jgi:hypothetical protein
MKAIRVSTARAALVTIAPTSPKSLITTQVPIYKRYAIKNPSALWEIPHGQNTDRFMVTLRDENGNQFWAGVHTVNKNTFNVILTTSMKGFVDVVFEISGTPDIEIL